MIYNEDDLIEALKSLRRVYNLIVVQETPISAVSFTSTYDALEKAKCYGLAVRLRTIENFFYTSAGETKEKLNKIIYDLQGIINDEKAKKYNTNQSSPLAGNKNADKRIVD